MRLKPGVRIRGVQPEILLGLMVLEGVFAEFGAEVVITDVMPVHKRKPTSLHLTGHAIDIRSHSFSSATSRSAVLSAGRAALGECFDFIWEPNPPHFHLELSPVGLLEVKRP